MTFDPAALAAPFPPASISWRAQSVTKQEPYKALALAYIDARDVMNRLDQAVGPGNWQDSYTETPKGRVICTLSIRIDGEWISKSDGAGDTDVEGDKGALSDALKRAAVKWGIGRYLYDMPSPWVPCEVFNGKWKRFTLEGLRQLDALAGKAAGPEPTPGQLADASLRMIDGIEACRDIKTLYEWKALNQADVNASPDKKAIAAKFSAREAELKKKDAA